MTQTAERIDPLLHKANKHAAVIAKSSRPNSETTAYDFDGVVEFSRRAAMQLLSLDESYPAAVDSLLSEYPDIPEEFDARSESREHVEIMFNYSQLRGCLYTIGIIIGTERTNPTVSTASEKEELGRILEAVDRIEASIKKLKADAAESRIYKARAVDQVTVNALIFSAPFGLLTDAIASARKEMAGSQRPSVRYIASVLESASKIADDIWQQAKSVLIKIPIVVADGIHGVALGSSRAASTALLLYYRTRRRSTYRGSETYTLETLAANINQDRTSLIGMISDFHDWSPSDNAILLEGLLFRYLLTGRNADTARRQLSDKLVRLQLMPVAQAKELILEAAEAVLDELSAEAYAVEQEITRRRQP